MVLDTEDQRRMLLQLIEASNIPGVALDAVFTLKAVVMSAPLAAKPEKED